MAHQVRQHYKKVKCVGGTQYKRGKSENPKVAVMFDEAQFKAITNLSEHYRVSFGEIVRRCVDKAIPRRISEQRK